jgi:4'-phosphopantetheinyl transferase
VVPAEDINQPAVWAAPPESLALAPDEIHVWRAALDLPAATLQQLWPTLSAEEQARALRFRAAEHRDRFIAARGQLRALLGRYLNLEAHELAFVYGPRGKPALRDECGGEPLRFNLTHSHKLVLYAVTAEREVGIDVERMRPDFGGAEVAAQFFSPREVTALTALASDEQTTAFFNCWTRKEAYIKARGDGLSLAPDQFDVAFGPGDPARLLRTLHDESEAARWRMEALRPGDGYVGAVVAEAGDWRLRCWQWSPETE